jgi:hypothetical protein
MVYRRTELIFVKFILNQGISMAAGLIWHTTRGVVVTGNKNGGTGLFRNVYRVDALFHVQSPGRGADYQTHLNYSSASPILPFQYRFPHRKPSSTSERYRHLSSDEHAVYLPGHRLQGSVRSMEANAIDRMCAGEVKQYYCSSLSCARGRAE